MTRSPIELSWTAKKLKVGATLKVHLYAQVLGTETWAWPNLWRATSSGIGQFEVWQDRGHFVSEKGSQIRPPVLRIWCSETLTLGGGMFDPVVRIHPVMTGWFSWTCAWMFGHQDGIWDRGGRNGIVGIVGRGQTGGSRLLPTRVVREPLRANGLASVLTSDHLGTKQTYNPQLLPSINWEWFVYFPLQEWQKYKIITHTWGKTDWLKKTSFPGTENQRDVPQLALPFSSFDLGGLLPPLLSVHSTPSPGRKGLFSCGCSMAGQQQRITRRRYAPSVVFLGNPDIACLQSWPLSSLQPPPLFGWNCTLKNMNSDCISF